MLNYTISVDSSICVQRAIKKTPDVLASFGCGEICLELVVVDHCRVLGGGDKVGMRSVELFPVKEIYAKNTQLYISVEPYSFSLFYDKLLAVYPAAGTIRIFL